MTVSKDFLLDITDQLAHWARVDIKKMFGGAGLYLDGLMFALVADNVVYLKVNDTNRARYMKEGSIQLKPFKNNATVLSYYNVPSEILENSDEFVAWCKESFDIQVKRNA